jgi:inner membrane protein|tara:strand:+ start:3610 stop:4128 length:519 start_codon:yes stop_codon:yes gene_type:complete
MLLKTHLSFGLLVFALLITKTVSVPFLGTLNAPTTAATLFFLIGLMLPDIDSTHSKISRKFRTAHAIAKVFTKHRGIIHSLFSGAVLTILLGFWFQSISVDLALAGWFFIGYSTHLLTDALTPHGVKPFAPFSKLKIRGPVVSGSTTEKILAIIIYSAALLLLTKNFSSILN